MPAQRGFTLIELIIVIVILGVLAVTAAPKFLNFGSDARAATVQGLAGAVRSASDLVFAKAVVEGKEKAESDILVVRSGGPTIPIRFGYIDVGFSQVDAFDEILELSEQDWDISFDMALETDIRFSPAGLNDVAESRAPITEISRCYVQYSPAAELAAKPQITINITDCN